MLCCVWFLWVYSHLYISIIYTQTHRVDVSMHHYTYMYMYTPTPLHYNNTEWIHTSPHPIPQARHHHPQRHRHHHQPPAQASSDCHHCGWALLGRSVCGGHSATRCAQGRQHRVSTTTPCVEAAGHWAGGVWQVRCGGGCVGGEMGMCVACGVGWWLCDYCVGFHHHFHNNHQYTTTIISTPQPPPYTQVAQNIPGV